MSDVFSKRLQELRGSMRDAEFSRKLGIPVNTLKRYEAGSSPSVEIATRIADACGVTIDWLAGRIVHPPATDAAGHSVPVPRFDVQASAGKGALVVSENVAEHFAVGREWLRRHLPPWAPANAVVGILEGSGDSMEPTIRDGDMVMVVQDVTWEIVARGGIFVFSLDGRLLLKRLQVLRDGSLRIISDNPVYEPELIPAAELEHAGLIIHGQVFFAGGKPRPYTPPQPQQQYFVPR